MVSGGKAVGAIAKGERVKAVTEREAVGAITKEEVMKADTVMQVLVTVCEYHLRVVNFQLRHIFWVIHIVLLLLPHLEWSFLFLCECMS